MAFQLCDAFLLDILRRKEGNRLYIVTSILASLFLDGNNRVVFLNLIKYKIKVPQASR